MERKDMKLGFIGFGNMAQAIAEGLLRSKALEPEQICACAKDWDKLCAATQPRGMRPCRDAREVAEAADVVIVAVKPHLIEEVLSDMKLGFIGFGNMAQAIAEGLLRSKALEPEQICACAKDWDKLCAATQPRGMRPCRDAREVAEAADVVIVAVKPHLIEEVLSPVRGQLADKAVVSVAAGWPFERYEALLPGTRHLSTMPNTPVRVCAGVFLLEEKHSLTPEEYVLVQELFGHLGLVQPVESRLLGIAGTLSGCGPAFVSMFIEALGDAGVKHGLPRAMAYRLAGQMVAGTGRMQVETGAHPGAMKDAVCSPGGTTIVGVAELERGGMRAAVINAVDAIQNK